MWQAEATGVEDIPEGMAGRAQVLVASPAQPEGRHSPHAGKARDLEFGIQFSALTFGQLRREIEEGCDVHDEICERDAPAIMPTGTASHLQSQEDTHVLHDRGQPARVAESVIPPRRSSPSIGCEDSLCAATMQFPDC